MLDVALEVVPADRPESAGAVTPAEVESGAWRWAYDDVTDLEPRRAGKTVKVSPLVLHRCGRPGVRAAAWMTGQKRDNAVKRFRDIRLDFLSVPAIKAILERANISNSAEVIEWKNTGSTFRPFAPDEDSMHGEDPDLVVVDELWSFPLASKDAIQAGYRPAWSVKSGQEWKLSAAGTARSGWLRHERAKGRRAVEADVREGVAFFEWAVPEQVLTVGGAALVDVRELPDEDLVEVVWANHPRAGRGLRREFLSSELEAGRGPFLRHYGGLDDLDEDDTAPIPAALWQRAGMATDLDPAGFRVALGFAVDPGRRRSAVCAAWRVGDGTARVVLVESSPGTRWVAGRVAGVVESWADVEAVGYRNTGLARDAADVLGDVRVALVGLSSADYAAASQRLYAGVVDGAAPTVLHGGAVAPELTAAMRAAVLPDSRVGAGWVQAGAEPIVELEAATVALWAADHLPERRRPSWTVY